MQCRDGLADRTAANEATTRDGGPLYRLSVDQYHELMRAGVFVDGDPIELVDGLLLHKTTKLHPTRPPAECWRR